MVDAAEVRIWGELAGAVRWDTASETADFQFTEKFSDKGIDLSPIMMPVKNGSRIYSFYELSNKTKREASAFKGLPGLLADSIPDRYGNELINRWLAQNGRPPDSMNPVEQLCFTGTRGMGALEFEPVIFKSQNQSFSIEVESLVENAARILSERKQLDENIHSNEYEALKEILRVGTSAGGARPKAVIAYNHMTGEVRSGQTDASEGFEHWLLKLDGVSGVQFGATHGFGNVEYAYYLMAKKCGIKMMHSELLKENNRAHFMTRRFDREGQNTKHHIHTFCGIRHFDYNKLYSYSYEQLFQTMRMLNLTYPEAEQMFRRMVFNVMATNYDDHTKNFSFRLKEGGKWELAPAYDICYSFSSDNIWVNQHTLSINGKHKNITGADLRTIAQSNNIRNTEKIVDEIREVVCDWDHYADKAEVSSDLKREIKNNIKAFSFKN